MRSIKVTILGKQYPLKVNESEVESMQQIAEFVDEKFRLYRRELNKQPESTIMALGALSIAEELFELRRKLQNSSPDKNEVYGEVNQQLEQLLREVG